VQAQADGFPSLTIPMLGTAATTHRSCRVRCIGFVGHNPHARYRSYNTLELLGTLHRNCWVQPPGNLVTSEATTPQPRFMTNRLIAEPLAAEADTYFSGQLQRIPPTSGLGGLSAVEPPSSGPGGSTLCPARINATLYLVPQTFAPIGVRSTSMISSITTPGKCAITPGNYCTTACQGPTL
jgi:hypothetical protein